MNIKDYTKGSLRPSTALKTIKYKIQFARNNPDYFYPSGIWIFCGPQGAGKTLSAVQTLKKLCTEYPKAKVCTNLEVKGITNEIIPFTHYEQIKELSNGIYGMIFLIDEIHVLWSSLESKDVPISEMAAFCQMRKERRVIIGTSQVYTRIAKPIREQLQYVIDCHNFFNLIQYNQVLDAAYGDEKDGALLARKICSHIWFHSVDSYKSYDTLTKIERAKRKKDLFNVRSSR